jgi:hypothetical protein
MLVLYFGHRFMLCCEETEASIAPFIVYLLCCFTFNNNDVCFVSVEIEPAAS